MSARKIRKGSTHRMVLRWEQPLVRYVPITGVSSAAPVVITAANHGLPDGWRFAVSGVKGGGSALNAKGSPPRVADYFKAKVLSANTVEINAVNGSAWGAYTSGGVLQYNAPVDLTGCTAVLQLRETADSATVLIELTSEAGDIVIDDDGKLEITFKPEHTSGLTVSKGVFDLELTFADNTVLAYPQTTVLFTNEVTRS